MFTPLVPENYKYFFKNLTAYVNSVLLCKYSIYSDTFCINSISEHFHNKQEVKVKVKLSWTRGSVFVFPP